MVFKKKDFQKTKFREIIINIVTSFFLVLRNFIFLIFYPYKTVRKICFEGDFYQVLLIFLGIFFYFKWVYFLKNKPYPASFTFFIFLINFYLTVVFFWAVSNLVEKNKTLKNFLSLIYSFSYSLFPTLIWFITVSFLYIMIPPPRTNSFLGIFFSIFFLAYSFSLLIWKIILVFLSLRFSLRLSFYKIIYLFIFYLLWFLPYSIFLYYLKIFKIPFI